MPREYRTQAGQPAPSPVSFGASDINLQTPRFVAQVNADAGVNPFEYLQNILGVGTQIAGQMLSMEEADVRSKITLQLAREQKEEKARSEAEREARDKANAAEASARLGVAKASDPAALEKMAQSYLGKATATESTPERVAYTQAAVAAQVKARQEEDAVALRIRNTYGVDIAKAVDSGDIDGLDSLYNTVMDLASAEKDETKKAALISVAKEAYTQRKVLNSNEEAESNRQKMEDKALEQQAETVASKRAVDIAAGLITNPDIASMFPGKSAESIRAAVFDHIRDRLLSENPDIAALAVSASDAEYRGMSSGIEKATNQVVNAYLDQDKKQKEIRYENTVSDAVAAIGKDDPFAAEQAVDDARISREASEKARRKIGQNFIESPQDPSASLVRYENLVTDPNVSDAVKYGATAAIRNIIKNQVNKFSAAGAGVSEAVGEATGYEYGLASRFETKEELLNAFLGELGMTQEDLAGSAEAQALLNPALAVLMSNWESGMRKSEIASRSAEASVRATTAAGRRNMKIGDAWKTSDLAFAITPGPDGRAPYIDMTGEQLAPMIHAALVGFQDGAIPDAVKKILTSSEDPANMIFIREFWRLHPPGQNSTVWTDVLTDKKMSASYFAGMYASYLNRKPPNDPAGLSSTSVQREEFGKFVRNYAASDAPTDPEKVKLQQAQLEAAVTLTRGAGLDLSWWGDYSGVEPTAMFETLPPEDTMILGGLARVAAASGQENMGGFMSSLMISNGYAIYKIGNKFDLLNVSTVPNANGVFPPPALPEPEVLESSKWSDYMNFKKSAVAEHLNTLPADVKREFKVEDIETIDLNPYNLDLANGVCAVRVKIKGGEERYIPSSKVQVSVVDFEDYKKKYPFAKMETVK